jgi:hypothetical protein
VGAQNHAAFSEALYKGAMMLNIGFVKLTVPPYARKYKDEAGQLAREYITKVGVSGVWYRVRGKTLQDTRVGHVTVTGEAKLYQCKAGRQNFLLVEIVEAELPAETKLMSVLVHARNKQFMQQARTFRWFSIPNSDDGFIEIAYEEELAKQKPKKKFMRR